MTYSISQERSTIQISQKSMIETGGSRKEGYLENTTGVGIFRSSNKISVTISQRVVWTEIHLFASFLVIRPPWPQCLAQLCQSILMMFSRDDFW